MSEIASISRYGKTEPFELQVSRGQVAWHRPVIVFGFNGDVDASTETIWPGGGILTYPSAAIQMKVSSSNANDTAAGTGARTVYIGGLDANHNEISETVTLSGQTAVTTTKSYLHINEAYVTSAGSGNSAAGSIYIGTGVVTAGVPATVYDIIAFDYNRRVTGSYTIPAGYTGYLVQGLFSTGQAGGSNAVTGRLMTRGENNIRLTFAVVTLNNGSADYKFELPAAIPEKTTVEAQAFGSSENNSCSSMFIILLVKNDNG
jgi:hypothetical protein